MWTYCIAFTPDLERFLMVRSRKRGGWEMPGGRTEPGETSLSSALREFREETGHALITDERLSAPLGDGRVFFGTIGPRTGTPNAPEISEVSLFERLPGDLAYPDEEYAPLIELGKGLLRDRAAIVI